MVANRVIDGRSAETGTEHFRESPAAGAPLDATTQGAFEGARRAGLVPAPPYGMGSAWSIPAPWTAPLAWQAASTRPQFRLGARIIDVVALAVLGNLGMLLLDTAAGTPNDAFTLLDLAWALISVCGLRVAPQALWGVTLGKHIVGLRLVRIDGARPGVQRILARERIVLPSLIPLLLSINYRIATHDEPYHQAIHDKVCGT